MLNASNMSLEFKEVDLTYLESIADGDKEIIEELINIFIDQIPEFTEGLRNGLEQKDWRALAGIAHKAKSSVVSMGMNNLGNVDLKNLELIAKSFRIDELTSTDSLKEKEEEELRVLRYNLDSYPDEKIEWVEQNKDIEVMKTIIQRFELKCNIACNELRSLLEK
jgi:HPt (histidine-containing phosphotransfer) domain-containing protein